MSECGAWTVKGVSSWDTPAYRKCVLPPHPYGTEHQDFEGLTWKDEE